jgi:hypothetical protein
LTSCVISNCTNHLCVWMTSFQPIVGLWKFILNLTVYILYPYLL